VGQLPRLGRLGHILLDTILAFWAVTVMRSLPIGSQTNKNTCPFSPTRTRHFPIPSPFRRDSPPPRPPPSTQSRARGLSPSPAAMKLVHRNLVRNGPGSVKVLSPLAPSLYVARCSLCEHSCCLLGSPCSGGLGLGLTQPLGFCGLLDCC
jgi:hypothetical protein